MLGKFLDLQKGSLTSMVDALEEKELVYRKGDPGDRRKTLVSLTEKGEEYRAWLMEQTEERVSEILNRLDEKDIIEYQTSLETLMKLFKKLDEKKPE